VANEFVIPESKQGHNVKDLVRYILGVCVGAVVLVLLFGKRGELASAWHEISRASLGWVLAAVAAEAVSLYAFAFLQRRTLRLAEGGTTVPMTALAALSLANDAIACSVPGEPVVSSAYRYRFYRRHGVAPASAGWTIFTILVAQAIGMSVLLLLGVIVALAASASAEYTPITIAGLIIVAAALAILVRRDLVLRLLALLPRAARRATGDQRHRTRAFTVRIESTLARMREIPLSVGSTIEVVAIAAVVWFADFCCLLCSFGAVRSAIPWSGVLLAYGVAQVAGSLPVVPGGFGIIEGSLAVILVQYGAGRVPALSAALVYRMISFWLVIAIGWITVGVIARHRQSNALPVTKETRCHRPTAQPRQHRRPT
jgi:putative heme transporter